MRPKAEPLTFQKVHRANHAASALFRWCGAVLISAGEPVDISTEVLTGEAAAADAFEDSRENAIDAAARIDMLADPSDNLEQDRNAREQEGRDEQDQKQDEDSVKEDGAVDLDAALQLVTVSPPPGEDVQVHDQIPNEPVEAEPEAQEPDRHFEEVVCFPFGEHLVGEEQEPALRLVAETLSVRPRLRLHLVGCTNDVEDDEMVSLRLRAVQRFFARFGLTCQAARDSGDMEVSARWPLGIVCQIVLDDDPCLRDFFLDRWVSDASPRTQDVADLLESRFHCCLH